jgi:hypothetical protein
MKLPGGAAFAVLESPGDSWPANNAPTDQHFLGYTLDDLQQPTFRYRVGGVTVEDFPQPVATALDTGFKRTFTFRATPPVANFFFRAASGKIVERPDGSFLIEDKLTLKFPGVKASVRRNGDKAELLVPVIFSGNQAQLVEEFSW